MSIVPSMFQLVLVYMLYEYKGVRVRDRGEEGQGRIWRIVVGGRGEKGRVYVW